MIDKLIIDGADNTLTPLFKSKRFSSEIFSEIIASGYTIDGHDEEGYLVKEISEISGSFKNYEGVLYDFDNPKYEDSFGFPPKLIVYFCSAVAWDSAEAKKRYFEEKKWERLKNSLLPNTYILWIGDSNLIFGSFYTNTPNFPNFEKKIQELIKIVAEENGISKENIICYGNSRGGYGALLHGSSDEYGVLAIDPLLKNKDEFNTFAFGSVVFDIDRSFFVDRYKLFERVDDLLTNKSGNDSHRIKILTSESALATFSDIMQLDFRKAQIINLPFFDKNAESYFDIHSSFIRKSVPLHFAYLNTMLIENESLSISLPLTYNVDSWSVRLHPGTSHSGNYIAFKPEGLLLSIDNVEDNSIQFINLELNYDLQPNQEYVIFLEGKNLPNYLFFSDGKTSESVNSICSNVSQTQLYQFNPERPFHFLQFELNDSWPEIYLRNVKIITVEEIGALFEYNFLNWDVSLPTYVHEKILFDFGKKELTIRRKDDEDNLWIYFTLKETILLGEEVCIALKGTKLPDCVWVYMTNDNYSQEINVSLRHDNTREYKFVAVKDYTTLMFQLNDTFSECDFDCISIKKEI